MGPSTVYSYSSLTHRLFCSSAHLLICSTCETPSASTLGASGCTGLNHFRLHVSPVIRHRRVVIAPPIGCTRRPDFKEAWNRNGTLPLRLLHRLLNATAVAAQAESKQVMQQQQQQQQQQQRRRQQQQQQQPQQQHPDQQRLASEGVDVARRDATQLVWPKHEVMYEAEIAEPSSSADKKAAAIAAVAAATPAVGDELDGLCEETPDDPGDCSAGGKGSFRLSQQVSDMQSAIRECSRRCRSCGRCRYISVSVANRDCSWYRSCELACGLLQAETGAKYTTVRIA